MKISNQINFNNNYKSTSPAKAKITNFKGWAACPLESITLRPNHYKQFNSLLLELQRECGQYFKIQAFLPDRLVKDVNALALRENQPLAPEKCSKWLQDQGVYLDNNNILNFRFLEGVTNDYCPDFNLARFEKVESKDTSMPFEGGNIFLGKKPNGDGYAIVGDKVICEMVVQILKRDPEYSVLINEGNNIYDIVTCALQFDPKYRDLIAKLHRRIADELHIIPKNIYCAKQSSAHIDMSIKPLDFPYVLVGDPSLTIELAKQRYANSAQLGYLQQMSENKTKSSIETKRNANAGNVIDISVQYLKMQGLIPIRVPGLLPEHYKGFNYMNAIVHQDTDGRLIYITNKNGYKDVFGIDFEEIFVDYLKKHVPSIKKVIFIDGNELIEAVLQHQNGGIHCLSLEKPDFKKWDELLKRQRSNN